MIPLSVELKWGNGAKRNVKLKLGTLGPLGLSLASPLEHNLNVLYSVFNECIKVKGKGAHSC